MIFGMNRIVLTALLCFWLLIPASFAKDHEWKTGTILGVKADRGYRGTVGIPMQGSSQATTTAIGNVIQTNTTYRPSTVMRMPVYATWNYYSIKGDKYIYICAEKTKKMPLVAVGETVSYYQDGEKLVFKDNFRKTHKVEIEKLELISTRVPK
jgi:hypothetical protein